MDSLTELAKLKKRKIDLNVFIDRRLGQRLITFLREWRNPRDVTVGV